MSQRGETRRRVGWGAVGLAVAVVFTGWASSSSGATTTNTTASSTANKAASSAASKAATGSVSTSTATGTVGILPSAGCSTRAEVSSGTVTLTPTINGKRRKAIVHVPTGYATAPVSLVVNLHGSQSTALEQEILTGMDVTADADTFIVVYPQAEIPAGSGFEWNVPGQPLVGGAAVPKGSPNDVSFVDKLVGSLEQRYCIDKHRIFATGFSGGARMASQLGCDASGTFAAVAPVSGLRFPTPCPSTRAVPVVAFHGTADPVDPSTGNGQKYWTYSVPVAAGRWAVHNGCSKSVANATPATGVQLTTYSPCAVGATVELYSIVGGGHEWPGGPHLPRRITRVLGPQSTAISANEVMWSFFVAHPLP